MKKLLSILALSSLVVGSVFAINRTGGNIGPGGIQPACDFGTVWCPVKNKCVATGQFNSRCFPNGGLPQKIGPAGRQVCPLDGQFYCKRTKNCKVLGANYLQTGALEVWCNTPAN